MIDLDDIEPDWELAKIHAKTTIAGKAEGTLEEVERCPCCFRKIINEPIGLFKHSKELEVLGFGYPLYLQFFKYSMILVLVQILSYNLLQLYNGIQNNQTYCSSSLEQQIGPVCSIFLVQIANLTHDITPTQVIMRVGSFALQLYFLIYIRNTITNTLAYYKERKSSISNFSILIKNLPVVPHIRSKIQKMFKEFFSEEVQPQEIILIGFLQEYYHLRHRKKALLKKKAKMLEELVIDNQQMSLINQELAEVERLLEEEVEKSVSQTKSDELQCEKVIVIVESEYLRNKVIEEFQQYIKDRTKRQDLKLMLGSNKVSSILFRQAPEPEQIIWEHINVPRQSRRIKQILGWVFTALFMVAIAAIFYFIIKEKSLMVEHEVELLKEEKAKGEALDDHGLHAKVIAIAYLLIFFIVLLNKFVISKFLHFISDFQKHSTYSKSEYYFSIKYTIALFLTTAVLTILVEDVTLGNIARQEYGIVEEESIMFLINSFFVPFLWLVNPLQIIRLINRKISYGKPHLSQRQANRLMTDSPASLGKLFGQTIQIIWFTYMYASVIPVGAMLVLLGFALNYWIVKYTILRRSSIEHQVSGNFITMALNMLDISLIMKPAGELLFDYQVRQGYTVESIVCTILAVVYCLLPKNQILSLLHKEQFLLERKNYSQVKNSFATNYQMLHPIYSLKKIYVEHYIERLKFYKSQQADFQRKINKKIPINLELALARRSSAGKEVTLPVMPGQVIKEDMELIEMPFTIKIHQRLL